MKNEKIRNKSTNKKILTYRLGLFLLGAGGGGRSAVSRASLAVPLSRRGGRTQTRLPSLFRPFSPLTNLSKKESSLFNFLRSGAGGGGRTLMKLPSRDFESLASAIPPHLHIFYVEENSSLF